MDGLLPGGHLRWIVLWRVLRPVSLLILFPYFLAMGAALLLLWMSARTGRRVLAGIAAGVQLLSPIPWLWLNYAMEYTASPFEVMMVVCAGVGMFLLLTLAPVRPTRNGM